MEKKRLRIPIGTEVWTEDGKAFVVSFDSGADWIAILPFSGEVGTLVSTDCFFVRNGKIFVRLPQLRPER